MASEWQGPVRNEGTSVSDYGPGQDAVETVLAMIEMLDGEKIVAIGDAWRERGPDNAGHAWNAAENSGRLKQVGSASWDCTMAVQMHHLAFSGMFPHDLMRSCAWAANDAGIAACTQDLIGSYGYTQEDYDVLIAPWLAGFGGQSIGWKQEQEQ
jgi:hypothetical protein